MNQYGGYEDEPSVAEVYDCIPGYFDREDQAFYLKFARESTGPILELGCGTGRILIPLVRAGCEVVGLDHSEYMLKRCRDKLRAEDPEVQRRAKLVQDSMVAFDLDSRFGLVTTPFRSFQHIVSTEEQLSCLRSANRHLLEGGRLILDLFNVNPARLHDPKYAQEAEDFRDAPLPDGSTLRRTHRTTGFHRAEQYNEIEMTYTVTSPGGKTRRFSQTFPMRYFYRFEMEHLLARCGFGVLDIFGNFDESPYTDDSQQMVFVAEKREGV
ncbi:MAG: class I SAM-dependent methyltransferase [Candidatus Latescibacteria bacterium]|jgi:SAM-dependent methyltransferase|nr:class I SAM-dependent methyltransferase [Candidatus Latescibacterota bacterium]